MTRRLSIGRGCRGQGGLLARAVLVGLVAVLLAHGEASAQAVQPGKAPPKQAAKVAPLGATNSVPPLPTPNPLREQQASEPSKSEPAPPATDAASTTEAAAAPVEPVAKPEPPTPEAEYMAKLDQLIAPVRDLQPSADDARRIKEAIRLTSDPAAARALRAQVTEPGGRRLLEWLALKGGIGEPAEFVAFVEANPAWPERQLLLRRADEQLFTGGGSAHRIKSFFKGEPKTGAGWAALASAYLAEGNEAKAREAAAKAWREHELAATLEQGFLDRFGALLTEADHRHRLDRILIDEVRFSAERNDRAAIARRLVPLLAEAERKKAEARIAIFLRAKNAAQLLAALPADPEGSPVDWGLAYQKVQHFRRLGQHEDAWKILKAAPTETELLVSPDDWWAERRGAAYDAIRTGDPAAAYELVREAGALSVNPLKDQTFLAGWIAFRLLDKPAAALPHFEASRKAADGPLSRARADYWLGRALEATGRKDEAAKRYLAATGDGDTFHGQLALQKLTPGSPVDIRPALPAVPTADEARRFNANEAVRAAVIAVKIGLDRNIKRALFGGLRNHLQGEGEMAMLAHLAGALGDTQTALRVGKAGIARGLNLVIYAYPLHAFPAYTPLRDPPEPAMLLGVARQETEFNNAIISTAGARGLLQVMPVTAQHICRDHKIKCDIPRLLTDNGYNAMIASAYIGDRMADFRGNYVLTLVSYNAGPGRARQWIRELGDPRDADVDPVDWIEKIPIEETREYVKKVLANVQVYRARLGDAAALRLEQDLTRTTGGRRAAAPDSASPAPRN